MDTVMAGVLEALPRSRLPGRHLRTLLAVIQLDQDRSGAVSTRDLAIATGIAQRHIRTLVTDLEVWGIVEREVGRAGEGNRLALADPSRWRCDGSPAANDVSEAVTAPASGVQLSEAARPRPRPPAGPPSLSSSSSKKEEKREREEGGGPRAGRQLGLRLLTSVDPRAPSLLDEIVDETGWTPAQAAAWWGRKKIRRKIELALAKEGVPEGPRRNAARRLKARSWAAQERHPPPARQRASPPPPVAAEARAEPPPLPTPHELEVIRVVKELRKSHAGRRWPTSAEYAAALDKAGFHEEAQRWRTEGQGAEGKQRAHEVST